MTQRDERNFGKVILTTTFLIVKYISDPQSESVVAKFSDTIETTSSLKYFFLRDGQRHLVLSKVIEKSPLKHLRLDPRTACSAHVYSKNVQSCLTIPAGIFYKSVSH
jgi:hypothetical protein